MKDVFIVATKRTPIGSFLGSLSSLTAPQLGAIAIEETYKSIGLAPEHIDSIYMGNVLSAGVGQSPARQAAIFANIPTSKDATTINKVCAAGMKATTLAAQQIQLGLEGIIIAGGMESMSNVPHYTHVRNGNKLGHLNLTDGMIKDGLWDIYNDFHMGTAAELGVDKFKHTREELDAFALLSYKRAQEATEQGKFNNELIPITIPTKKGNVVVDKDEDIYKLIPEKVATLAPAFRPDGKLTAANSSNLNDGAAVILLASQEAMTEHHLKPLAKIIAYADAAQDPEWFTTTPALAIEKVLKQVNLTITDIDFFEINEAYASVILSNQLLLGYDMDKVNIYGGAVALGHPIGTSGARIITTLINVLKQEKGRYGVAAICNGGGGATAILIENMTE